MYIEQFQKNDAFESPQPTKNLLIPPSPGKVLSPPNTYIHSLTKFDSSQAMVNPLLSNNFRVITQ